ncbi:hypothetical protein BH11MYX1_BH11MYX1_24370 [soil metagenome]
MRFSILFLASALAITGCKKDDPFNTVVDGPGSGSGSGSTFTVRSSDITLLPGEETTKCFYFHTPNTSAVAVKKWTSHMAPGSHHMIMYFASGGSSKPDGTVDEDCGLGGNSIPVWVYAAQTEDQELALPSDDGTGMPLAQNIPAGQAAYFQMHYINLSDAPETVHVELNAFALAEGVAYTPTAAYITYHQGITIGPDQVGAVATGNCAAPAGVKFWTMSSHAHKQAVHTQINDGSDIVFQSDDWEHPGAKSWDAPPFYTFTNPKLTFSCTYNNNNANDLNHLTTIHTGQSALTDEMCMATGYIFPATQFKGCLCTSPTTCYSM